MLNSSQVSVCVLVHHVQVMLDHERVVKLTILFVGLSIWKLPSFLPPSLPASGSARLPINLVTG